MATKYTIILWFIYLAAVPAWGADAQQPPGSNVEELINLVHEKNPELATVRSEADAMSERKDFTDALPDPTFRIALQDFTNKNSADAPSLIPSQVGSTYYRVMQPLPFWGKRDLKREIAVAEAAQSQGKQGVTWSELSTRVKIDFAQYYLVFNSYKLTQEMLQLTQNLERIAKSRYATGLAPQQDVIRAQVEQTGLRRELVMLETERHHSMTRLNTLLLREPYADLAVPLRLRALPSASKLDFGVLSDRLRSRNPQLFTVNAQLAAADKNRDLVLKNRYPDFAVGVGATQSGSEIKSWELMLELSIPLQQGARRAQEREADNLLNAARYRKEAVANQLLGNLAEYVTALDSARQVESLTANSLLPQAEATLQAAYVGYQNGKVDFSTLLEAQRQILKARLDVLNAQAQAQNSLAQIEKLLGEEL